MNFFKRFRHAYDMARFEMWKHVMFRMGEETDRLVAYENFRAERRRARIIRRAYRRQQRLLLEANERAQS